MTSQTSVSPVGPDGIVRCLHSLEAASFVCKNGENRGRRFFKCRKHKDTGDTCVFWMWEDQLFPPQNTSETQNPQNPSPPSTPQKRHAQADTAKKTSKRARFELIARAGDTASSDGEGSQSTQQQMLPSPPSSAPGRKSAAVTSRRRRDEDQEEDSDPDEDMEDGTSDRDASMSPADRTSGTNDPKKTFKKAIEAANDMFDEVFEHADRQQDARSKSNLVQGHMLRALRDENARLKKELRECKEENQKNQETILNLSRALSQALHPN